MAEQGEEAPKWANGGKVFLGVCIQVRLGPGAVRCPGRSPAEGRVEGQEAAPQALKDTQTRGLRLLLVLRKSTPELEDSLQSSGGPPELKERPPELGEPPELQRKQSWSLRKVLADAPVLLPLLPRNPVLRAPQAPHSPGPQRPTPNSSSTASSPSSRKTHLCPPPNSSAPSTLRYRCPEMRLQAQRVCRHRPLNTPPSAS